MSETTSHRKAKGKAAGKNGRKEIKLTSGKRLDASTKSGKTVTEIERSGDLNKLKLAASRLKERRSTRKVLQVPQKDMQKAVEAMKIKKVHGTVKNMGGTKRQSV